MSERQQRRGSEPEKLLLKSNRTEICQAPQVEWPALP